MSEKKELMHLRGRISDELELQIQDLTGQLQDILMALKAVEARTKSIHKNTKLINDLIDSDNSIKH